MSKIEEHPTVLALRGRPAQVPPATLEREEWRRICLEVGADDVGFVNLDRGELDDQREDILRAFPATQSLVAIVCRMNREPVRSTARSLANQEFHHTTERANDVAHEIATRLEARGVRASNPPSGFPMEMSRFPGRVWTVSHKPVAVAAGLGHMGIHRNVIHPKFGNFVTLGTVLVAARFDEESRPLDYNPCLSCKLCVAACPVGAIKPDGRFDPSACLTHNYREFMGGFNDWVEQIADSRDALDYRRRLTDSESASMWQSLSFGANYKAAYCMAVCPAGEDVIPPYLADPAKFTKETARPLQEKKETVYVVAGSDAEEHVQRRYPHKLAKRVAGLRPTSVAGFLFGLKLAFQAGRSKGVDAVYHFTFTGPETTESTVTIRDQSIDVQRGLVGTADCRVVADAATWVSFLRKERSLFWAIVRRRVRVGGRLSLLKTFARCFPS